MFWTLISAEFMQSSPVGSWPVNRLVSSRSILYLIWNFLGSVFGVCTGIQIEWVCANFCITWNLWQMSSATDWLHSLQCYSAVVNFGTWGSVPNISENSDFCVSCSKLVLQWNMRGNNQGPQFTVVLSTRVAMSLAMSGLARSLAGSIWIWDLGTQTCSHLRTSCCVSSFWIK